MTWDNEKALTATQEFHVFFKQFEEDYPTASARLREAWKVSYLTCGHKRLGRVVLGQNAEEANR
jgi:hypothetical protein